MNYRKSYRFDSVTQSYLDDLIARYPDCSEAAIVRLAILEKHSRCCRNFK